MPYDIVKRSDGYHVINQETGEDKGCSETRGKAEAHMRAMYAHEGPKKHSPGMMAEGGVLDDSYVPHPVSHVYVDGMKKNIK